METKEILQEKDVEKKTSEEPKKIDVGSAIASTIIVIILIAGAIYLIDKLTKNNRAEEAPQAQIENAN